MAKWWTGVALVGAWLALAMVAQAQLPGPIDPTPMGPGSGACGGCMPPPIPGPLPGPPGPPDLGLPPNTPNASTPGCCQQPCPPCVYFSADYLLWWFKNPRFNQPVLTSTTSTTITPASGSANDPNVTILLPNNGIHENPRSGGRLTAGYWFDCDHIWAFEASAFLFERRDENFLVGSPQIPFIAAPFFNVQTQQNAAAQGINAPNVTGSVQERLTNQLWGAEANFIANDPNPFCCCIPVTFLAGFRYLDFDEQLETTSQRTGNVAGALTFLNVAQPAGSTLFEDALFRVHDQFAGGQIGLRTSCCCCGVFIAAQAKIAIGNMHETSTQLGTTTLQAPAPALPVTVPGRLFVGPSNTGTFTQDHLAYIPEGEVRIGYTFSPHVQVYAAYNYLYVDRMLRAPGQIDYLADPRQDPANAAFVPGFRAQFPQVLFRQSDFWAQGVNIGMEIIF